MNREYYDAQIKYINEIRSIKHDIQAHMIILQYYLESENYDKAKEYLSDMKQHQSRNGLVVKDTGNDLVNAIISDTLSCSSKEIDFELEGILPECLSMSEYDVCTLFSNLFSNAREACEKLKVSNPVIRMEVKETEDSCYIIIQNPIEWKIELETKGFVSSKENKEEHGIGTRNIIRTIKQNHGKVDFYISDEIFRVEMILKNKKSRELS